MKFRVFKNYGQEVEGPIHGWSPNLKVGDQSPHPFGSLLHILLTEHQIFTRRGGYGPWFLGPTRVRTASLDSAVFAQLTHVPDSAQITADSLRLRLLAFGVQAWASKCRRLGVVPPLFS